MLRLMCPEIKLHTFLSSVSPVPMAVMHLLYEGEMRRVLNVAAAPPAQGSAQTCGAEHHGVLNRHGARDFPEGLEDSKKES